MIKLIIAIMAGVAGHQMNSIIEGWENEGLPRAWSRIARYVVGVVIALPIYVLIRHGNERSHESDLDIQAYIMAFVGTGVGVAAGYLLDDLK